MKSDNTITTTTDNRNEPTMKSHEERYTVKQFKPTNAKKVPYEQLDFTIYKRSSNSVVFHTCEARMPIWIRAISLRYKHGLENEDLLVKASWEEINDPTDTNKCEKIMIKLTSTENDENIASITTWVNTGRIQFHGRHLKDWGRKELTILTEIVDNSDKLSKSTITKNLEEFTKTLTTKDKSTSQNQPNLSTKYTNGNNEHEVEDRKQKAITDQTLKNTVADLETYLVTFMEETKAKTNQILNVSEEKDKEIKKLIIEIVNLKQANSKFQKFNSDITLEYSKINDHVKNIYSQHIDMEKKIIKIEKRERKKESTDSETQTTPETMTQPEITVETSNSFTILSKEHPSTSNTSIPSEKTTPIAQTTKNRSNPKQPTIPSETKKTSLTPQQPTNKVSDPPSQNNTIPKTSQTTHVNHAESIILCDSNGHLLKPDLLCPDSSTAYIRCPTLDKANSILENTKFTNAKTFILHSGTNDLEKTCSNELLVEKTNKIINKIQHDHPKAKIVVSGLLPRNDSLNDRVGPVNKIMKESMQRKEHTTFVEHNEIEGTTSHLYDKKHLNSKGVKIFAKNLKKGYFKSKTSKEHTNSELENQNYTRRHTNRNLYNRYQHQPKIIPRNKNGPSQERLHPLMDIHPQERNYKYNNQQRVNNNNKPDYNHLHSQLMNLIYGLHRYANTHIPKW